MEGLSALTSVVALLIDNYSRWPDQILLPLMFYIGNVCIINNNTHCTVTCKE